MSSNDNKESTEPTVIEGEASQVQDAKPEPTAQTQSPASDKASTADTPKKPSRWPVLLLFLLLLIVAAGVAFTYTELLKLQQTNTASNDSNQQRLDTAIQDMQDVRIQFTRQRELYNEQDEVLDSMGLRLNNMGSRINEITQVSRQSWLLAEAEYLLRLANQRLILEGETAGALGLLQAADKILVDIDDVNLYPVRGQLAKEILALQALGNFDRDGLVLKLAAMASLVEQLELLQPEKSFADEQRALAKEQLAKEQAGNSTAGSFWQAVGNVSRYVRIYRRDEPVEPLLAPEQHYYIQQNLRLMLEQAQLAAMQRNQTLYQEALNKAGQWVQRYFALNPASQSVVTNLNTLAKLNVAPAMPDISTSLQGLKDYLGQSTRQPGNPSGQTAAPAPAPATATTEESPQP